MFTLTSGSWPRRYTTIVRHLFPVMLAAACSREATDWKRANTAGTVAAYEQYIAAHPNGTHAAEATSMLAEARGWETASTAKGPAGLRQYLRDYPSGRFAEAATSSLRDMETAAFEDAKGFDTHAAYSKFLGEYPDGVNASAARELAQARLLAEFRAETIVFARGRGPARLRGKLSFSIGRMGILEDVPPNPATQRIAVVVEDATGLPAPLETGRVYIWKGGRQFVYLRSFAAFRSDADRDRLSRDLGVASKGGLFGRLPF